MASTTSKADATSSLQDGSKPRTRQRIAKAPPPLQVPDIEQDAAERKRVLNVLAQRRYRERKRQDRKAKTKSKKEAVGHQEEPELSSTTGTFYMTPEDDVEFVQRTPDITSCSQPLQPCTDGGVSLFDLTLSDWGAVDGGNLDALLPDMSTADMAASLPPDFLTAQVVTTGGDMFSQLDTLPADGGLSNTFPPFFGSPSSFGTRQTASSSPSDNSSETDFPDSYLLPVHELTLLKAFTRISTRMGCDKDDLWSLECISPFALGTGTPAGELPAAWRPTATQRSVAHHPVFDFFPWPSARDRIITILSLPDAARPPGARGPLAMVNFVYDFEDSAEGVRIYGADPYDPGSWEVGQVFFERWWFLFDREIIANSNRWREIRGAAPLLLKGS